MNPLAPASTRKPLRLSSVLGQVGNWLMASALLLCTSLLALRVYEIALYAWRHG